MKYHLLPKNLKSSLKEAGWVASSSENEDANEEFKVLFRLGNNGVYCLPEIQRHIEGEKGFRVVLENLTPFSTPPPSQASLTLYKKEYQGKPSFAVIRFILSEGVDNLLIECV